MDTPQAPSRGAATRRVASTMMGSGRANVREPFFALPRDEHGPGEGAASLLRIGTGKEVLEGVIFRLIPN